MVGILIRIKSQDRVLIEIFIGILSRDMVLISDIRVFVRDRIAGDRDLSIVVELAQ